MISSVMPVHIITAILGLLLLVGCILVWISGWFSSVKQGMEDLFTPNKNLFDQKASYTGAVTFFRWYGLILGALLVLPTFVLIDISIAAVTLMLWRHLAKRAKAALTQD